MHKALFVLIFAVIATAVFIAAFMRNAKNDGSMLRESAGNRQFTVLAEGLERRYLVHIPPTYDGTTPVPAVIMLHGGGGTGVWSMEETGWTRKADREGFLAVFPDGTRPDPAKPARFGNNPQSWNDGSQRAEQLNAVARNVDDVGFINSVIDNLIDTFVVDEKRIYIAGFSNGASMTYRVGVELSDRIAAIAPVAGALWLEKPQLKRPVSLIYMTGTADSANPIKGGTVRLGPREFGVKPPLKTEMETWARLLACPTEEKIIYDDRGVKGVAYAPCAQNSEVVYYTIEGMGHAWPGGKNLLPERLVGKTSNALNATDVIWDFFEKHPIENIE